MTSLDLSLSSLRTAAGRVRGTWNRFPTWLNSKMPKGLYARSLLIIVVR